MSMSMSISMPMSFESKQQKQQKQCILVVSGTSSGVGKTTIATGLMAAFAKRGLVVQPFKCGPDFLDGMHHEAAILAGGTDYCTQQTFKFNPPRRRCVNLDGWMMGSTEEVTTTFQRHAKGADVCIIEGAMGLHDSRDGISDDGSAAQIAKILGAPVLLVIDASMMARSVAAMALGYAMFDPQMRLGALITNKVAGKVHIQWIADAIHHQGEKSIGNNNGNAHTNNNNNNANNHARLVDVGTDQPVLYAGALPHDTSASVPERHLGLTMPAESIIGKDGTSTGTGTGTGTNTSTSTITGPDLDRYIRLAGLMEENIDIEKLLHLGQTCKLSSMLPLPSSTLSTSLTPSTPLLKSPIIKQPKLKRPKCRIGIADDEAFCFYYVDNLHQLEISGAELIPFSPLRSKHLPPFLDGLYIGGGYPELHSKTLEDNVTMRNDIRSFCHSGGIVLAECGGLMYLSESLFVSKNTKPAQMCGVFPGINVRMTPHMKMFYADIEFTANNPLFRSKSGAKAGAGGSCRGQKFHFSEVMDIDDVAHTPSNGTDTSTSTNTNQSNAYKSPLLVTPQLPGATSESAGFTIHNTFMSYFHIYFASYIPAPGNGSDSDTSDSDTSDSDNTSKKTFADVFVENAIKHSPHRKAYAVSFVSAATEIIFAMNMQSKLAGVTSLCDFPLEARYSPRQIICHSPIDASTMSSEEVEKEMKLLRLKKQNNTNGGPPGHWLIDEEMLSQIKPSVVFVQNTCDICDPATDDVLHALEACNLSNNNGDDETNNNTSTVSVAPTTLEGLFESIRNVATALNTLESGLDLITKLRERLQRVKNELAKTVDSRPTVLSLEGLAPLCVGGNWLPDLKYAAGCKDALGDIGGCSARILSWEEILDADPDVLIISPCSASISRTLNEMHLLASAPAFWKLRCVQEGEVYIIEHGPFARPGPRLIEGVELLATVLRGISPPSGSLDVWKDKVLKYQCQSKETSSASHCTTELSARFTQFFANEKSLQPVLLSRNNNNISLRGSNNKETQNDSTLRNNEDFLQYKVTRCTIPGFQLPPSRSAHCIVPVNRNGKGTSLLLFGGEDSNAKRLCDVWELHAPSKGWSTAIPESNELDPSSSRIGNTSTWEYLRCGKVADENVPTLRSNHAVVVCGDYMLTFGGWGIDNVTPLSNCELLHLESLCWTHCSTRGNLEPSPRGNPSLVYCSREHRVILFGGWNGAHALNDMWSLDLRRWRWTEHIQYDEQVSWPSPRTDHTAVIWEKSATKDCMLVFGGNIEGKGPCSELWALEMSNNKHEWRQICVSSPSPSARTSHTASIIGKGDSFQMIIAGGTNSSRGVGISSMLCDAWILSFKEGLFPFWIKIDWNGSGLERCRHAMAVIDSTVILWGGYNGEGTVNENACVWQGYIPVNDNHDLNEADSNDIASRKDQSYEYLKERWEAEIPVRLEDLPKETREKAERSKLPGAVFKALHRHAVANNRDTYIDPASGYSVFSQVYLKRRPCCGNACRHCPHGHINVPGKKDAPDLKSSDLEW